MMAIIDMEVDMGFTLGYPVRSVGLQQDTVAPYIEPPLNGISNIPSNSQRCHGVAVDVPEICFGNMPKVKEPEIF